MLEVTPNEFKNIHTPYIPITSKQFETFTKQFKNKASVKDICAKNDLKILKSIDNQIDSDIVSKISAIREKLYLRRIKSL